MTRRFTILVVCGCLGLAGCAGYIMPNAWEFRKSSLKTIGWTNFFGTSPQYSRIEIGTPEKPFYKSAPPFAIKLSDGRILLSSEFSLETIRKVTTESQPADEILSKVKGGIEYIASDCTFTFRGTELIRFEAWIGRDETGKDRGAVIGTYNQEHFYKMPITHQQLIEIFGKPDAIKKDWIGAWL